jgi:ABC-type nickel/cobalt efflux system permease component RcnA
MNIKTTKTDNPMSFGMALTGGIGLALMIVALGMGVVQGENSDTGAVSLLFLGGLLLLVIGVGAWVAVTRPFAHFDDITQPKDTGHGHGSHDQHEPQADAQHETPALPTGGAHH